MRIFNAYKYSMRSLAFFQICNMAVGTVVHILFYHMLTQIYFRNAKLLLNCDCINFMLEFISRFPTRGRSHTTLTRFCQLLTTYPPKLTFSTSKKSRHFWTTYPPVLVKVVFESHPNCLNQPLQTQNFVDISSIFSSIFHKCSMLV